MAKLEAVVSADIKPFEAALAKATAGVQDFGKKAGGVGNDLLKNLSGIDIEKALGIGVAVYAAKKLSDALVDAGRKGLEAFEAYERAVLRFKYVLPAGPGGAAAAGARAEEIATMAGAKSGLYSAEQMRSAALYLAEASRELRESPEALGDMLDTLKAFAIKTASTPEAIAEAYRRLVVGIKEEGGMAVSRFFKTTPGMEAEVEKLRDAHAEAYLHAQGLTDASQASAAQASEYHRLQTQSVSDFMAEETSRKGATAVLEEIRGILERSAPKAIVTEAEAAEPRAMLTKAIGAMEKAFGEKLKPAIDDFTRMIISNIPIIQKNLTDFGENLGMVIEGVIPMIQAFGNALSDFMHGPFMMALGGASAKALEDAKAISDHVDQVIRQKKEEAGIYEESAKAAKDALAAQTGVFAAGPEAGAGGGAFPTRESIKSAEEVAKIAAKTDAAHEESQRRISFEQAQSELRASAIAAARATLINRPRGMTEALDKQYAAEAEANARIINIRAAATEKANAANEEAANRIAKINEEQSIRDIDREAANAMDQGEQKSAILARLNAEDAAAQLARNDAMAEARAKERDADMDAANAIIDAQEEAVARTIDAQKAAALAGPGPVPEFGKWKKGPGGYAVYEESSYEREARRAGIEREFDERKRQAEDQLEAQRPTTIGLKRTHEIQQEQQVKAIKAQQGRTEADEDFAAAHKALGLPAEPKEEAKGKEDISRKVIAQILTKIWDSINIGNAHFEDVFVNG